MIYLLGGCPLLGKTTSAREISYNYRIPCIEVDDLCNIIGKTTESFNIFRSMPYYDYFTEMPFEQIEKDAEEYQRKIERYIISFIKDKSVSGDCIIEGFCIYPHMIVELDQEAKPLFFVGTEGFIEQQYKALGNFGSKSKNKEAFDNNYIQRLKWYNSIIAQETIQYNTPFLEINSHGLNSYVDIVDIWGL